MRIAFVTFEYPPSIIGGAGIYAVNITREIAGLGHEVVVFTPKTGRAEETQGGPDFGDANIETNIDVRRVDIHRVNVHRQIPFAALQFWLSLPGALKEAEEDGRFDLVHINGISYGFIKKRLLDSPHVITVHHLSSDAVQSCRPGFLERLLRVSSETSMIMPLIERRGIASTDRIIAVSRFTRDRILKTFDVDPWRVALVYNGLDIERRELKGGVQKLGVRNVGVRNEEVRNGEVRKGKGPTDILEELRLAGKAGKPIVLSVGRVDDPRKGLDLLLEAFKRVLDEVDAGLLIVGRGDQSPAKALSASLGISGSVFFAGFQSDGDLQSCYELCDLFVSPSRLEGFGLTIIEAMASGRPVVSTRAGAIPEIVKDRENGLLVDTGDVEALAGAICTFLRDPGLSRAVGERNAAYAQTSFCWKRAAEKTESIYKSVA